MARRFTATGLYANRMRNEQIARDNSMVMGRKVTPTITAVTNTMLDNYDLRGVPIQHESLVLSDMKVLHRLYCMLDATAIEINLEELNEDEIASAKSIMIELIEYSQAHTATKPVEYKIVFLTYDGKRHYHSDTFSSLKDAAKTLIAVETTGSVKGAKLVNPETREEIYKWTREDGRLI